MKRDMLASACAAMVAFATTAGVTASSEKPEAVPATISIPVYFFDATGKLLPPKAMPGNVTIDLGAILGGLGGHVGAPLQTVHVSHDQTIQLDLAGLSARLTARASQFEETDANPLELTPQETRIARVSTVLSLSSEGSPGVAVGFWDLRANGSLTLLYCDRPCRLRSSSAVKSTDDFEFDALSAGLSWMLSKKDRDSHFVHVRAVNPQLAVVICPPGAFDKVSETLNRRRPR